MGFGAYDWSWVLQLRFSILDIHLHEMRGCFWSNSNYENFLSLQRPNVLIGN